MRSPTGPILIILGLATAVVLALVLVQTIGLRGDLQAAREDVGTLRAAVGGLESGISMSELSAALEGIETQISELELAGGGVVPPSGDPSSPAGGSTVSDEVLDRIEDVLARIEALDARVDEICGNVPVC